MALFYNPIMRLFRVVAIWTVIMSGAFSVVKDFWFAYLASIGQAVPNRAYLVILGQLSMAAFVLSGMIVLWMTNREATALKRKVNRIDRHREIYTQLSGFLTAADKIKRVCSDPEQVIPTESAEQWEIDASRYIRNSLGEAEANRFLSETNVPAAHENPFEPVRAGLLRKMHYRSFQLSKLIDEHRLSVASG